jgi:hypothetical protein
MPSSRLEPDTDDDIFHPPLPKLESSPEETISAAASSGQSRTSRGSRVDKKVRKRSPKTVTSTENMMPKLESTPEDTTSTATIIVTTKIEPAERVEKTRK